MTPERKVHLEMRGVRWKRGVSVERTRRDRERERKREAGKGRDREKEERKGEKMKGKDPQMICSKAIACLTTRGGHDDSIF